MVEMRIAELLHEKGKSRYWLVKNLDSNYTVINKMLANDTTSISFDTIDKLCDIFDCEPCELFKKKN